MQIAFIILAIVAAMRAHQQQPQTSFVPADEPLLEAIMEE